MTLVVPFDGSALAETALARAVEFNAVRNEGVLTVAVVPQGDVEYARERDWIADDEPFDMDAVVSRLEAHVHEIAPDAEFEHFRVGRYAPRGTIASRIRRAAREHAASMVLVGSENAGHFTASVNSVGKSVAAESTYDVLIVRQSRPAEVDALRERAASRASDDAADEETDAASTRPD